MTLLTEIQRCFEQSENSGQPIMLISVGGFQNQDLPMSGNLQESDYLQTCPQLKTLLNSFPHPLGRVCLIKLSMSETIKSSPLYQNRAHPLFYQTVYQKLGSEYTLLVETRRKNFVRDERGVNETAPDAALNLSISQLDVITPAHICNVVSTIIKHCRPCVNDPEWQELNFNGKKFSARWQALYTQFGNDYAGEWSYQSALNFFRETFTPKVRSALTGSTTSIKKTVEQKLVLISSQLTLLPPAPQRIDRKLLLKASRRKKFIVNEFSITPQFERPIFIVSAPRAGSTLLFETLSQLKDIWSTGEENHALLEDIAGLHPHDHDFRSNHLNADDANTSVQKALIRAFTSKLQNREQQYYLDLSPQKRPNTIRFLEKTPKNALRIPFINALFPNALFVYLQRDFRSNVSSLIDGWRSQRFIAYRNLPGFKNRHWSFLLTPGWENMHDRTIAEIAHYQWQTSNQIIQQDLTKLPKKNYLFVQYQDLITQPEETVRHFAKFANLEWDQNIQTRCEKDLPVSRLTLSKPQDNKWQKHQSLLNYSILEHKASL